MLVNQIAVFLENRQGRINDFAKVLANENIDLVSMSIADTKEFGILRAITSDNKAAVEALRKSGFTVTTTDLIGVEVDDRPGGLFDILNILNNGGVDIEYLYSYSRSSEKKNKAVIMFKVSNLEKTFEVIKENNIRLI
ncbi:MAG: hypothetical protein OSJ67_00170 [Clostridia bacterium]|jgi:hypothetical protein|nr:hypothetical protein [Clostridia bacterium]